MESVITINGKFLNKAQAATIRMAVEAFAEALAVPGRLGDDAHAFRMTESYSARLNEIRKLFYVAPQGR